MIISATMRISLAALLSLLLAAWPTAAQEAQPDETAQEQPAADGAADDAAEQPPAEAGAAEEGTEVFIPSEEISEDFAVSFPVDI